MAFQIDVTNADTWKREVLEVPGTLQVVELYQTWCGPCKAIQGTFKRVYFDAGDKPLKFITVSSQATPFLPSNSGQNNLHNFSSLTARPDHCVQVDVDKVPGFEEYRGKCQPVFLFYKDATLLQKVEGVEAPIMLRHIVTLGA